MGPDCPPQFLELHRALGDAEALPPKRILVTTFVPSAWADDALIAERKAGLTTYLNNLIGNDAFRDSAALNAFLSDTTPSAADKNINLEDALPSTLSRKAALAVQAEINAAASSLVAAAYYPDWAAGSNPPESLDYSKFDVLLFGELSYGLVRKNQLMEAMRSVRHAELVVGNQLGQRLDRDPTTACQKRSKQRERDEDRFVYR